MLDAPYVVKGPPDGLGATSPAAAGSIDDAQPWELLSP